MARARPPGFACVAHAHVPQGHPFVAMATACGGGSPPAATPIQAKAEYACTLVCRDLLEEPVRISHVRGSKPCAFHACVKCVVGLWMAHGTQGRCPNCSQERLRTKMQSQHKVSPQACQLVVIGGDWRHAAPAPAPACRSVANPSLRHCCSA